MNTKGYILIAEDDPQLSQLLLISLNQANSDIKVVIVRDGEEVLDYMYARNKFRLRTPEDPSVLLLDLKMPKINGLEVLRQLKNDRRLKVVPIVMLSASQDDQDILTCYQLGANAYVTKFRTDYRDFLNTIKTLALFWVDINERPSARLLTNDTSSRIQRLFAQKQVLESPGAPEKTEQPNNPIVSGR